MATNDLHMLYVVLENDRRAKLIFPKDITNKEIKKIKKLLGDLKDDNE